ncbi:mitochondrial ribosomal subunit protein-domain-containing protein [Biscogniauxia marginata]|nr:mitochondrial ribosomal subunit protein-domain-containing protein [Biscogniauxia marginata]
MASAVQPLRLCLRTFRQAPVLRNAAPRVYAARKAFSTTPTPWRPAAKKDEIDELEDDEEDEGDEAGLFDEGDIYQMQEALRKSGTGRDSEVEFSTKIQEQSIGRSADLVSLMQRQTTVLRSRSFWNDEEEDPDMITDELNEDEFDEDDIMSMAHGKLEEFREYREYARIAAWEIPLLSKLARPFEPPTAEEPLRFRFTSYMGEFHPAESKVVVEFSPQDMPLNEAQQLKLKKLLGARYNPDMDIARMSCEQFEHQAQNKRYLGDLVNKLIASAQDPTDMFEDVPLDTRHHKTRPKPKFPPEWRMTEERRKFLEETRKAALLLDQTKEETGKLVDGAEKIQKYFDEAAEQEMLPERVTSRLERQLPTPNQRRNQNHFRI